MWHRFSPNRYKYTIQVQCNLMFEEICPYLLLAGGPTNSIWVLFDVWLVVVMTSREIGVTGSSALSNDILASGRWRTSVRPAQTRWTQEQEPQRKKSSWHGTLFALLDLCEGKPPRIHGFLHKGEVMRSFNAFLAVRLNKLSNKQSSHAGDLRGHEFLDGHKTVCRPWWPILGQLYECPISLFQSMPITDNLGIHICFVYTCREAN